MTSSQRYDVVLVGAGLAGLSLARHLLLDTDKRVLLLERRPEVPSERQKVGESTVQVAGYYLSKILDLEEYLQRRHYMKYNLRFYWPTPGLDAGRFQDYSASYIRELSNIASYQLDRNELERELLRRNLESDRFHFVPSVSELEVALSDDGPHAIAFRSGAGREELSADWVVDTSGRGRYLAKRLDMKRPNSIHHGAFFWWVDGLVDIEKLTDLSRREARLHHGRRRSGHLPSWLATNHFCFEGGWFWVIPLQGKTSLGLVYDHRVVAHDDVFSVEKATRWVCERFPIFARDLPERQVLDFAGYRDFSYDCARTISPARWALAGEAGRFTDPLYSPGSDLISIYNTLIVDAVETDDRASLAGKCPLYEQLMRSVYAAYEPSYAVSYDALGDQETFTLKYVWELAIYFAFYVFPFTNDLLTEARFQTAWLRRFARLGPINGGVQRLLSGYFQWKKSRPVLAAEEPVLFEMTAIAALYRARETFYAVDPSMAEAKSILAEQLGHLEELARFFAAWVGSRVLDDVSLVRHAGFVEAFDLADLSFDPEGLRRAAAAAGPWREYPWSFDPEVLEPLVAAGVTDAPRATGPIATSA
ncbi:MAG: tryptophan 7-halogenase [Thermoanaerobaculia bacterium]